MDGIPYTLQWADPFPSILPLPMGIWTRTNTRFLGPTRVHNPKDISVGSTIFAGLHDRDRPTDRQTDHAVSVLTLITPQLAPLPLLLFTPNLITVILSTTTYRSLSSVHLHNLISFQPLHSTRSLRQCIKFKGSFLWNKLPNHIKILIHSKNLNLS